MTAIVSQEGKSLIGSRETIVYLLDASGSMSQPMTGIDGKASTRISTLKNALRIMFNKRLEVQGKEGVDMISLVVFSGFGWTGVRTLIPIKILETRDLGNVSSLSATGGTPMKQGLQRAVEMLDTSAEGMARIVLMSDGMPNSEGGGQGGIVKLVREASEDFGIVVDTVGIGTKGLSASSDAGYDADFMKLLASVGKGEFYDFSDGKDAVQRLLAMESERRTLMGNGIMLLPAAGET